MKPLKVILSGGGTGGHIFPAVAIANEIRSVVPDAEILFVGAIGRMEMEKVPASGYRIVGVPIAGLQRKFSLKNFKLPFLVLQSLMQSRKIIRDFGPDVVVGTGGYVSGPVLFSATRLKIPALIQEQNSYAGITNKFLSKRVQKVCVAYQGMERFFPADKILLTGNPVRKDISNTGEKRQEAFRHFNLDPSKPTVLVIGGSLGARTINEAIEKDAGIFQTAGVQVLWQTGKAFSTRAAAVAAQYSMIRAHDFVARMDLAYALADVVISRAGASSVSELCIVGLPSILVPSPNVAEDHQTSNAMALVRRDAALMVKDIAAKNELCQAAVALLNDASRRQTLVKNIRQMAFPDAAKQIANEVIRLSGRKS